MAITGRSRLLRNEDGSPLQPSRPQIIQGGARTLQRIGSSFCFHPGLQCQREERLGIRAGEIGHRSDGSFFPQIRVGKAWDDPRDNRRQPWHEPMECRHRWRLRSTPATEHPKLCKWCFLRFNTGRSMRWHTRSEWPEGPAQLPVGRHLACCTAARQQGALSGNCAKVPAAEQRFDASIFKSTHGLARKTRRLARLSDSCVKLFSQCKTAPLNHFTRGKVARTRKFLNPLSPVVLNDTL